MGVLDKLNGTQDKAPETPNPADVTPAKENEAPKDKENKTPTTTLEQVIGSTGQDDRNDEETPKEDPKDKVIISLKRELRENKKEMSEVKTLVTDLVTALNAEKSQKMSEAKIVAFAEKRGVDPDSIRELAELLRDEVAPQSKKAPVSKKQAEPEDDDEEDIDEDEDEKPVAKKFSNARLAKAVDQMVTDFLDDTPEYEAIVDIDTVKEIILANPQKYIKMPINEIIDKIYGKSIKGKGGIEKIKSNNRQTEKKSFGKLSSAEFKEIKNDPEAMKEYKSGLISRARKFGLF
jgi:hypothetical protein